MLCIPFCNSKYERARRSCPPECRIAQQMPCHRASVCYEGIAVIALGPEQQGARTHAQAAIQTRQTGKHSYWQAHTRGDAGNWSQRTHTDMLAQKRAVCHHHIGMLHSVHAVVIVAVTLSSGCNRNVRGSRRASLTTHSTPTGYSCCCPVS